MERNKSPVFDVNAIIKTIEYVDADEVIKLMKKIDYVNLHHKNAISHHVATVGDPLDYYYTRLPDGNKRMKGVTKEALIEKLYNYYYTGSIDYSFRAMFLSAIDEKIKTEAPKEKTIRDYHFSYKRFIDDDFGKRDIRKITHSFLKEYIQKVIQEQHITKKSFYKFKSVLNLVFEYATDLDHQYISINPVPHKNRIFNKNCIDNYKNPEDKAFQPFEIELIKKTVRERINNSKYDVNGYAILFSIETGVREGEIPSLKWSDIYNDRIHIHSQQNDEMRDGKKVYYYNPTTKNEKGISQNGRYIPLTNNVRMILTELKNRQATLGIKTEWVFARINGEWTTTKSYSSSLYNLCKGNSTRGTSGLGLRLSNNHAFRMALNSYVFIPMGLPVTERAKLLGHSVDTNLKYYSFAQSDNFLNEICNKWDDFNGNSSRNQAEPNNLIDFTKEKSSRTLNSQAFF